MDARDMQHVRAAVLGAPLRDDPSPHVYVENVFAPDTYAEMLRLFPDAAALRRWDAAGAFGNYERRREIAIPRDAPRLTPEQQAFWLSVSASLQSAAFFGTLLERFEPYARARFGDRIDDPSFFADALRPTMILNEHDAGYYLGPHTDRGERVFTCLFYFPEHDGLAHLGTTLYRPLEPGFSCSGTVHHDPAHFEPRETIPYRPNSVLVFPRSDVLFHGVHPLSAGQLQGSRRRGMQIQFLLHNERSRESCKTTLRVTVPATMRAGAVERIPVALTNRAAADLESSFPHQTQLGFRWLDGAGREVEPERSIRTPLPGVVRAGETAAASIRVAAPTLPGRYVLRISVVQEGVAWFDDVDPSNGAASEVFIDDPAAQSANVQAAPVASSPGAASDIVPESDDLALGDAWYPVERGPAGVFRWVENGAVVHVAALRSLRHVLRVVAEPGPGVGLVPFTLSARLADGREIGSALVSGKQTVSFALPPESPRVFSVGLYASGGGRASTNDPRVLNFRVFAVAVDRSADVFPAWAVPSNGFHPLERQNGELFRWVGGDAVIELSGARRDALEFDAESGPGMRSQPFALHVVRPDGADVANVQVGSRTRITVPLDGASALDRLVLRGEGGGIAVPGDARILDFRVFAARVS